MANNSFFNESLEQSQIKAKIVSKYFWAWAKVVIPYAKKRSGKIAYIDLFSGPGRYKDGAKSTPLLVLEKAIADSDISQMLVTLFNDIDKDNSNSLHEAINSIHNISHLKYKPQILNLEVGEEMIKQLQKVKLIPTLFFIDPWGYKGLSIKLIGSMIKDWGCDCIFFFNYNRINMGLNNKAVTDHMNALFGEAKANELRNKVKNLSSKERELSIVEAILGALQKIGGQYTVPFRFKNSSRNFTSHHLIFVSKHEKGYEIIKEIMAKESSLEEQGVSTLEYNPATANQPLLFEFNRPLDNLAEMLREEFSGQTLKVKDVYHSHHIGRRYIKKNYKEALIKLESMKEIIIDPPANKRRKDTLSDKALVTFKKDSSGDFSQLVLPFA